MPYDTPPILRRTADEAGRYLASLDERPVGITDPSRTERSWPEAMPATGATDDGVLDDLLEAAASGVVASGSPRYFGFVIGGALPVAIAAEWLAVTWDQNAGLRAISPFAAEVEDTVGRWVLDVLDLPATSSFALVTGCQMAHVTCLAAARHHLLARLGWDVERRGLHGAPPVRVLAGESVHVTVPRALRLLGMGSDSLERVAVDGEARLDPDALRQALATGDGRPTIVCAQLGEVNTGAMDPVGAIAEIAHEAGAWLHVDGAFGLWARASRQRRSLTSGAERADSWATDAHKWLNVPYDCGVAICAHPDAHRAAFTVSADYLMPDEHALRDPVDFTPEFSRRARGIAVYAALRSLGRDGIADLVERSCALAERFACGFDRLPRAEVLEPVVLNQVLVAFGDDRTTEAVVDHLQAEGTCWMSGTRWRGRSAMRISVVNWRTTPADVDLALDAIGRALATIHPHDATQSADTREVVR